MFGRKGDNMTQKGQKMVDSIPVVLVTPEMAKEWLDTRFDNERPLRAGKWSAMARDMENGRWYFAGDPIRFDEETGRMVDGQHRLTAVVRSDTNQYFPVVNLPRQARTVLDTGSARTLGDMLTIGDHVHGKIVAAIIRKLLVYRNGRQGTAGGGRYVPTMSEGIEFVNENKEELVAARQVALDLYRHGQRFPMAPSSVGAAYFLCARKDKDLADSFFNKLTTGLGLEDGEPVLALRNRALKAREMQGRPISPDDAFRFIIIAWNLTRDGTSVSRLLTPRGGWTNQNVPVPK